MLQRWSLPRPFSPNPPALTETYRGILSHILRMHNGGEFGEGTKSLRRIILSPLDTMGTAAFNCFKRVLLHTRASTQEGVAMGSDPAQEIKSFSLAESLSAPSCPPQQENRGASRMHFKFFFPLHNVLAGRALGKTRKEGALDKVALGAGGTGQVSVFLWVSTSCTCNEKQYSLGSAGGLWTQLVLQVTSCANVPYCTPESYIGHQQLYWSHSQKSTRVLTLTASAQSDTD